MCGRSLSANPQIFRGRFAPVLHLFVAHLSTLIEVAQAGLFHGRDVHKHVLAAVVGLNKSKSLSRVEPLHSTCRHVSFSPKETIVAVERRKDSWASKNPPAAPASFLGSILSADLDRSNPPAVAGMHAATDNVATAVIVVVVVVCVGIVSVIVAVGSEAEPYKRTSVKFASVKSSTVEATVREPSMKAATAEASST